MKKRISIEQVDEVARAHRERLVASLKAAVSRTVRPIISTHELSGGASLEASCILVGVGEHHFLLSAAHVLKKLEESPPLQVLGKDNEFIRLLAGKGVGTPDDLDAAVMTLPRDNYPQFNDGDFLPVSYADPKEVTTENVVYTAFGFPVSRSRPSDTGKHLTLQPVTVTGRGKPGVLTHLKLSSDTHIAIEFDRLNSLIRGGGYETVPVPEGMSGGPVFRLDFSGHGQHRLVGIVTHWPTAARDALIAVHIGIHLGGMKELIPSLPFVIEPQSVAPSGILHPRKRAAPKKRP